MDQSATRTAQQPREPDSQRQIPATEDKLFCRTLFVEALPRVFRDEDEMQIANTPAAAVSLNGVRADDAVVPG